MACALEYPEGRSSKDSRSTWSGSDPGSDRWAFSRLRVKRPATNQQEHGKGDLHHQQPARKARLVKSSGDASCLFFKHLHRGNSGGAQSRQDAENHSREDRDRKSRENDDAIEVTTKALVEGGVVVGMKAPKFLPSR